MQEKQRIRFLYFIYERANFITIYSTNTVCAARWAAYYLLYCAAMAAHQFIKCSPEGRTNSSCILILIAFSSIRGETDGYKRLFVFSIWIAIRLQTEYNSWPAIGPHFNLLHDHGAHKKLMILGPKGSKNISIPRTDCIQLYCSYGIQMSRKLCTVKATYHFKITDGRPATTLQCRSICGLSFIFTLEIGRSGNTTRRTNRYHRCGVDAPVATEADHDSIAIGVDAIVANVH